MYKKSSQPIMRIRQAEPKDLEHIVRLEQHHHKDEISGTQSNFHTSIFNHQMLKAILQHGWIAIAENKHTIIGYVLVGDWQCFSNNPLYKKIIQHLPHLNVFPKNLSKNNCCQYGPIWIDPEFRGQGIFQQLVTEARRLSRSKYDHMLAFIAEDNQRSYFAHTQKGAMKVVDYIDFEDQGYYLLLG